MKKKLLILFLLVSWSPCLLFSQSPNPPISQSPNPPILQDTLTLWDAIQIGLEENFSIILSKYNLEVAQNNNTVGNAGMLPSVNLNATNNNSFNTTHQKLFNGTEKNVTSARNISLNTNVALSWTLFDGLAMFTNKEILSELEAMGEMESRMMIENTVSAIILNYYGIVQQKKMVKVLQDAVDLSLQRKTIAQAKFSLGSESEMTLLQSSVDLNADSNMLIQQIASLENSRANLNQLLGRDPRVAFETNEAIDLMSPLEYDSLLAQSETQNIDLMLSRSNLLLSELDLRSARSDRYPQLNFNASYGYNQLSAQTGYLEYNQAYGPAFGFTLSYNLFNGFNTSREIRNARIAVNSAEVSQEQSRLDVTHSIYIIYRDYKCNLDLVRLETVNQDIAKRNVDVALEKYRLGTISDIDLRETQKKLIDSQYQLLLAQFRTKQAETELRRISGELYKSIP
jgi:outer membrane protein TolC